MTPVTISKKLTVKTEGGNFNTSNISMNAADDKLVQLAEEINSLQSDSYAEIIKTVTKEFI